MSKCREHTNKNSQESRWNKWQQKKWYESSDNKRLYTKLCLVFTVVTHTHTSACSSNTGQVKTILFRVKLACIDLDVTNTGQVSIPVMN